MLFRRRPVPGQVYVGTQGSWESAGWRSPVQMPGHAVLRLRNGEITTLTGRESTRPGDRYRRVDLRRVQMQVHPQTVPTAEGLDITITAMISLRVVDPLAYVTLSQQPENDIYFTAQVALRELVAGLTLDEVLAGRLDLTPVTEATRSAAAEVGVEIAPVLLKDLNPPRGYAEAVERSAVDKLTADMELERARTEVKTTRARLGTAKVLEQNPLLARLRLLESLPPGTTLEIRGDNSVI